MPSQNLCLGLNDSKNGRLNDTLDHEFYHDSWLVSINDVIKSKGA